MLDAVRRDDRIAVYEQHTIGAARQRRADASIHPAGETKVAARLYITDVVPPVFHRVSIGIGRILVDDDDILGGAPRRAERLDDEQRRGRRSMMQDYGGQA